MNGTIFLRLGFKRNIVISRAFSQSSMDLFKKPSRVFTLLTLGSSLGLNSDLVPHR
jgi:hypothetical protein